MKLGHKLLSFTVVLMLTIVFSAPAQNTVWVEKDGYLIVESESTRSPLGKWVKKTDNPNYTGTCHLEFTGNTINGGNPNSPLHYTFKINKAGVYELKFRCRKRLDGAAGDKCNDAWVRVEGDYTSGGDASLEVLKKDTKLYGGPENGWGWSAKLDPHSGKVFAKYNFKSGEIYELVVSGRSIRYNIDRIVFYHSTVNLNPAATAPESDTLGATPVINDPSQNKAFKPQTHISYINGLFKLNDLQTGSYSVFLTTLNGRTIVQIPLHVAETGRTAACLNLDCIVNGVYIARIEGNSVSDKKVIFVNK